MRRILYRVCYGRETLRRRLDLPDDELDFEVLIELRERGGTDYIALPIDGVYAAAYMLTFVTDRPHGFGEDGPDRDLCGAARLLWQGNTAAPPRPGGRRARF